MKIWLFLAAVYLLAVWLLQCWQTALLLLLVTVFLGTIIALLVYSWQYMKEREKEKWEENP